MVRALIMLAILWGLSLAGLILLRQNREPFGVELRKFLWVLFLAISVAGIIVVGVLDWEGLRQP
ncbi:hypothetical protein Mesil_0274 [Allomeiothermus silvanus DSM 9946]|uniref:Uncharacterized protein n=1 Tax=Allomeiothermus silvanus (strain ATCC 700542 / DSM 9946 / NBRC 106475 / NCIMB 13440 / VI-R2) TaxID=526227 RepID=D7BHH8_ALLS1|nr:hypothetical protein [Allomeiothermus silvanus]ADH62216.1 hypothetical protein Mesil_0274 [Allomeiothermus silvanus DSM 9946]